MTYSYSVLAAFRECPTKGILARDTPRFEKAGPSVCGQAAHALAQAYTRHLWYTKQPTDIEVGRKMVIEVTATLTPEDRAYIEGALLTFVESDALSWCMSMHHPVWEERVFVDENLDVCDAIDTTGMRQWTFGFTPDLWYQDDDGLLHFVDWKSGWNPDHIDHPSVNDQLLTYCALGTPEGRGAVGEIFHMRHGYRETAEYAAVDLDITRGRVRFAVDAAKASAKHYRTGAHCVDCDFRQRCPAYAAIGHVADAPLAERVAALVVLENQLSEIKSSIRNEVGEAGEIEIPEGRVARMSIEDRWEFDNAKLRAVLGRYLDADSVQAAFKATKTSLASAVKKAPGVTKDLVAKILAEAEVEAGVNKMEAVMRVSKRAKGRAKQEVGDE